MNFGEFYELSVMGNNTMNTYVILSGAKHALSMSKGIPDAFTIFEPVRV